MALTVWTRPTGFNLFDTPGYGVTITSSKFVIGDRYVIVSLGTTDFMLIGAFANTIGGIFIATGPGIGTGTASETWLDERTTFDQPLPVVTDLTDLNVKYTIISGGLPGGLRLSYSHVVGTPYSVPRNTLFTFCVRASSNMGIADRTFTIIVNGSARPTFVTQSGDLPIGPAELYFVLDSTHVHFQIAAFDTDIGKGQHLSYFIADGDGELPPGLSLSDDGLVSGFIQPVLSIKPSDGTGWFDTGFYDTIAYDFGYRPTNGYDSYDFDAPDYDYSLPTNPPRKLNRNYSFTITLTDGDAIATRTYNIFVVADDYFRADNTTLSDSTGIFTADVTYLRKPIWVTNSNLGTFRANNYMVFFLDTYDKLSGQSIEYTLISATDPWHPYHYYNIDDLILIGSTSHICIVSHVSTNTINPVNWAGYGLPPGMAFDFATADVYGRVPYQPAISITYRFTVSARRTNDDNTEQEVVPRTFNVHIIGEIDSILDWVTTPALGTINANYVVHLKIQAISTVMNSVLLYTIIDGYLPNGLTLLLDGEISGSVNQFSTIDFDTQKPTIFDHGTTFFDFNDTSFDSIFKNSNGLTTFDYLASTTFDNGAITFDRIFTFTAQVRDQYGYSASTQVFTLIVDTPNQVAYSNIRTKPFMKHSQRALWSSFINDNSIFTPSSIYRVNDSNFGVQSDLSMVIYAGIQTTYAAAYIGAMGLNHKRKRFQFGTVVSAVAIETGTHNEVYEVIYISMIDPLEPNAKRLPSKMIGGRQSPKVTVDNSKSIWGMTIGELTANSPDSVRPNPLITVDSTGYAVSSPNPTGYFPSSISNWQDRFSSMSALFDSTFDNNTTRFDIIKTERNYLPLWMRSIQPGSKSELGFTLSIPLCYCKVGMAAGVLLNINHSGFDFKMLDYTADRFIIDTVEGYSQDKYMIFRSDRITI